MKQWQTDAAASRWAPEIIGLAIVAFVGLFARKTADEISSQEVDFECGRETQSFAATGQRTLFGNAATAGAARIHKS